MDGFQVVGRKNKIRRRVNKTVLTCDSQSVKDFDIEKCKEKINSYRYRCLIKIKNKIDIRINTN